MKKIAIISGIVILFLTILYTFGVSKDTENRFIRKSVELLSTDYRVTYATGQTHKEWIVKNGKVSSEPEKGYYFFWDEKKHYVQTPIENTFIEGI